MSSIISVENISKAYRIGLREQVPDTMASAALGWIKSPLRNLRNLRRLNTFDHSEDSEDTIWALKDVSFEIQEGEAVGIIGRNGAGKSTLLKILSRITEPTDGRVTIRGRVSSLLEVGTGFHPELTGRENIYMNGTVLGMTKREIDRKFDEIVDFSGVEKFLDTPIKRYSSGMQVRLAFSVAAHLEPEILIVDEVLAVGDAEFQRKCLGKMHDVASGGRTVLFVSHNMAAVAKLCSRSILLMHGSVTDDGPSIAMVNAYMTSFSKQNDGEISLNDHAGRRPNSTHNIFQRIVLRNQDGIVSRHFTSRESIDIELELFLNHNISFPKIHIAVTDFSGNRLFTVGTDISSLEHSDFSNLNGKVTMRCHLPQLPLNEGTYFLLLGAGIGRGNEWIDMIDNAASFDIELAKGANYEALLRRSYGPILIDSTWSYS